MRFGLGILPVAGLCASVYVTATSGAPPAGQTSPPAAQASQPSHPQSSRSQPPPVLAPVPTNDSTSAAGDASAAGVTTAAQDVPARVDYARDIQPFLKQTCFVECHGPTKGRGQLRLHTRALTMKGGVSGAVIVPGKSDDSLLVQRLLGPAGTIPHEDQMPLEKEPLPPPQLALICVWIDQGAQFSSPATPTETHDDGRGCWSARQEDQGARPRREHRRERRRSRGGRRWCERRGQRARHGDGRSRSRSRGERTRAALGLRQADQARASRRQSAVVGEEPHRSLHPRPPRSRRLTPSAPAAKHTWLRRVTLDLTGLPPTPAEVDAFLADQLPTPTNASSIACSPRRTTASAGRALARPRPLRRHQRLREGPPPLDLAVPRLGHRRPQRRHALRPVHHRADRRRHAPGRQPAQQRRHRASTATR